MNKTIIFFILILIGFHSFGQPWFQKASFGGEARHRTTTFTIGNYGYLGLGHINSGIDVEYEDFWKYDPASDSWAQIANYPEGPCFHVTGFVIGSIAYVGTGRLENGSYTKKFHSYDPITNMWVPIADFPGTARRGAVSFVLNGKGYVGTGQSSGGLTVDFYEYNPVLNLWNTRANLPGLPRTSSVAFSINSYGYVGTGQTNSGSTNDFYQYDPMTNTWTAKADVGPTTRQEATGFAVNGLGYIGTGDDFSSGNNFNDMWEYNPTLNSWTLIEQFAGTARRYLNSFVIGSRAYAGTGTNGTNFRDFWMFDQVLSVLTRKMSETDISTYPNPCSDKLIIDLENLPSDIGTENLTFELYSVLGNLVSSLKFEGTKLVTDISALGNGNYIYKLKYKESTFKSSKIIITH